MQPSRKWSTPPVAAGVRLDSLSLSGFVSPAMPSPPRTQGERVVLAHSRCLLEPAADWNLEHFTNRMGMVRLRLGEGIELPDDVALGSAHRFVSLNEKVPAFE